MLERDIERKVGEYAKKLGVWHRKFVSPQNRGVPDRVFAYKGIVIFIEFKAPGKKPTPLQQAQMDKIRAVGVQVYVCDSVEEGKKIIDRLIAWTEL